MTESSSSPIPNRTSTATMLDTARKQYADAVRDHNILATEIRAYQKTLAEQVAQSTTPHAAANRVLAESYRKAIADTTAAINARTPQLQKLKKAADDKGKLVTSLSNTLATENSLRAKQAANQPRTDNQSSAAPAVTTSNTNAASASSVEAVEGEEDIVVTARIFEEFAGKDHRVRLSAFVGQEEQVYGPIDRSGNVLAPLHSTQGLLFPYTPTISVSQDTSWTASDIEGGNYDILSFQKSSSANITLSAKFTAQNQREGEYMFAAIHFLRTVSKAYFGERDADHFATEAVKNDDGKADASAVTTTRIDGRAGLPPPVLILSGYGSLMFNNVRCVVKSHSWAFDENADMVKIKLPVGETVWLPPILQISITLGMQNNTDELRETFSLDDFRTGKLLLGNRKGWF